MISRLLISDNVDISTIIKNRKYFDSHCHLNEKGFDDDRDAVVDRARKVGLEAIVDIGTSIQSSKKAIANSQEYDIVYAAVGIDPENLIPGSELFQGSLFEMSDEDFDRFLSETEGKLTKLAQNDKVLMIGETGIDNYWLEKNDNLSDTDKAKSLGRQKKLFRLHIRIARKLNKPLTIHSRNAIKICLDLLQEESCPKGLAVFHSLTPDNSDDEKVFEQKVREILEAGYLIGVNGIITFKNADLIRNVYSKFFDIEDKNVELEELYAAGFVLETDAPFLAPEPKRGERNEPGYLEFLINTY